MQRTHLIASGFAVCALTAAAVWLWTRPAADERLTPLVVGEDSVATEVPESPASPFSVTESASGATVNGTGDAAAIDASASPSINATPVPADGSAGLAELDVTTLGYRLLSDAEFEQLAARLRANPALLQQLIDEFRQEVDTTRRDELSRLLGEVGGSAVTLTASELIYSGDAESRRIGLELLQRVQPGNAEARDIASSLLATEVEPDVLVGTLTTLARPGAVDDDSRDFLTEQVAFLTTHDDATVRGISLNILSRWSTDNRYTPVLLDGLKDQVNVVRESAAYALVGHEDASDSVIAALFAVATDPSEHKQARRGSILALRGMEISEEQRQRLIQAELELDTQQR